MVLIVRRSKRGARMWMHYLLLPFCEYVRVNATGNYIHISTRIWRVLTLLTPVKRNRYNYNAYSRFLQVRLRIIFSVLSEPVVSQNLQFSQKIGSNIFTVFVGIITFYYLENDSLNYKTALKKHPRNDCNKTYLIWFVAWAAPPSAPFVCGNTGSI